MAYTQKYFQNRNYSAKQQLVERHLMQVLRWAIKKHGVNLLDGAGKRALDVGCACGYATRVLEGLGYSAVGVDVSAWGVKQAKAGCGADFLVCDAQNAVPLNGGFDLVVCLDVLEHLPNPAKAIMAIFGACRVGGVLVCTTPNRKVERLVRSVTGDYDETHINVKEPEEWRRLFVQSLRFEGLAVESYFDAPVRLGGKLFFKSFNVPAYGLTVRVAVRK